MHADRGPLQTGQRFAGCEVGRLLGAGASSAVYAVFDEAAGEWRALKVFNPQPGAEGSAAAETRDRFSRELALARRLQHPDIVRLHDGGGGVGDGTADGGGDRNDGRNDRSRAWLLMDLLPGTDLSRYTTPARRLPEPVALRVAERLARALAHAHALGIVHRDLKPANVMVDWATDRVTLTDFGVARAADSENTRTGLVLGSPAYMAPELLAGAPPTAASDLYALGVLLFQLLTARLPFDSDALGELLRQVAQQPAPDLRTLQPGLPDDLAALVGALLAKAPSARPKDGHAVADSLMDIRTRLLESPAGRMSRG
jgi:serine/threonine-protein kinase